MRSGVFGNLDREKTVKAFEQYLREWKAWKLKAMQNFPTIGSPSMDGQPHGTSYDSDKQFVNHSEAEFQWQARVNCCKNLMSIGEEEEILGDILLHRFIKGWSAIRTMSFINDKYKTYYDDRAYRRKQEQALWEGALMCPDDDVRVSK